MVQCISTFIDLCYIFWQNIITASALTTAEALLKRFHELCQVFITEGVCKSISLPRQHALPHYLTSITLIGSPNGLCSSITESKHIKAVEPWHRSSQFRALIQMLWTITRLEKLAALWRQFLHKRLLCGSTAGHFASNQHEESQLNDDEMATGDDDCRSDVDEDATQEKNSVKEHLGNAGPEDGPQSLSSITLATSSGILRIHVQYLYILIMALSSRKTVSKRPLQIGTTHQ
jgi:hypothetical protein